MEKVKQHKRLVITTSTLLLLALVLAGIYWQTMSGGSQPSPSPTPTSSLPGSSSESETTSSEEPGQTKEPALLFCYASMS